MRKDFCLSCGTLLPPHAYECAVCGFNNRFGEEDQEDLLGDDHFLTDYSEGVSSEEDFF